MEDFICLQWHSHPTKSNQIFGILIGWDHATSNGRGRGNHQIMRRPGCEQVKDGGRWSTEASSKACNLPCKCLQTKNSTALTFLSTIYNSNSHESSECKQHFNKKAILHQWLKIILFHNISKWKWHLKNALFSKHNFLVTVEFVNVFALLHNPYECHQSLWSDY